MAVDDDEGAGSARAELRRFEGEEPAEQNRKRRGRKGGEDGSLETQSLPEHRAVAQGIEPDRVDVPGQQGAAAQEQREGDNREPENGTPAGHGSVKHTSGRR